MDSGWKIIRVPEPLSQPVSSANANALGGLLHAFDCPDMTSDNQSERFRSSLPAQSLALMNNPLVMRASKAFMQEVLEKSKNNYEDAVKVAFDEAYNRPPTPPEQEIARKSIASEWDPKEGLRLFIQAMFGANNFLYGY
jgi:hypothetical protein